MNKTEQPTSAGGQLIGDGSSMVYNGYCFGGDKLAPIPEPPALAAAAAGNEKLFEALRPVTESFDRMQKQLQPQQSLFDKFEKLSDTFWAAGLADDFVKLQALMQPAFDTLADAVAKLNLSYLPSIAAPTPAATGELAVPRPPAAEDAREHRDAVIDAAAKQPPSEEEVEERHAAEAGICLMHTQETACIHVRRRAAWQAAGRILRREGRAATQARITITDFLAAAASQNKAGTCPPPAGSPIFFSDSLMGSVV